MPDSRKVHLLIERDPITDPPRDDTPVMYRTHEGHTFVIPHSIATPIIKANTVKSWMPPPTASDLTVEDIVDALALLAVKVSDETRYGHHKSAARYEAIANRFRAALGMETP